MTHERVVPPNTPLNAANRYAHIDALRAFAVVLVVVAHAGLGNLVPGGSGVTVFFAISGFIITYLALHERVKTGSFAIGRFYFRRAAKLAPPFVALICVPTIIWALFNQLDWTAFAAQVFFVFNWYKVDGGAAVLPGSGVVWSLAIEEQFYVVFALLWLLLTRSAVAVRLLGMLSIAIVLLSSSLRFLLALEGSAAASHRIYYGTDTRVDAIALGLLCAIALQSWELRGRPADTFRRVFGCNWSLVASVGIFALSLIVRDQFFRDTARYSLQAVAACLLLLYGFLSSESLLSRLFLKITQLRFVNAIGLASYSIYLVHLPLIYALNSSFQEIGVYPRAILLSAVGILTGLISYHAIEVPALRARRFLERSTTQRPKPK